MNQTESKSILEQFIVMKRGVSYRRVSTDEQADKGFSLPTQLKEIHAYAAKNGIEIVADFQDDYTGSSLDRPGLKAALDYLSIGQADCIICLDADRLTREPGHYMTLRDFFKERRVELHYSKRGKIDLSDFGQMLVEDFYGRFAAEWKRKLIEATSRGRRGKVEAGHVITHGRWPYGYRLATVDGMQTLKIYEPEARIILLIFELYILHGLGAEKIAQKLSEDGISTPTQSSPRFYSHIRKNTDSSAWARSTISLILKNPVYTGTWTFHPHTGGTVTIEIPAIISPEVWKLAETKRGENQKSKRKDGDHQYLMSGRVTCAECDSACVGFPSGYKGRYILYYRCNCAAARRVIQKRCGLGTYFRVEKVDGKTWEYIKALLLDPIRLESKLLEYIERKAADVAPLQAELSRVDDLLSKVQKRQARLLEIYLDGTVEKGEYQAQKKQIDLSSGELEKRKSEVEQGIATTMLTRSQIDLIHKYAEKVRAGIRLVDTTDNFEVKRQIINILDVRAMLGKNEAGQKIATVSYVLSEDKEDLELSDRLG